LKRINLGFVFLVFAIILFKQIAQNYNYQHIRTDRIKKGMILSFGSVLLFKSSRIKNLPKETTETTTSRITQEEAKAIQRWSKTKKGKESVVIVKHLPFAPFIFGGTSFYLLFKLIIGGIV